MNNKLLALSLVEGQNIKWGSEVVLNKDVKGPDKKIVKKGTKGTLVKSDLKKNTATVKFGDKTMFVGSDSFDLAESVKESDAARIAEKAGKVIIDKIDITTDGSTFAISSAYEKKVKEMGYSIGTMEADNPRGIADGDKRIAKWTQIDYEDYPRLNGVVECEDNRDGSEATIYIFGTERPAVI